MIRTYGNVKLDKAETETEAERMEQEREEGRGRKTLPSMSKRIREDRYGPGWETVSPVVSPVK